MQTYEMDFTATIESIDLISKIMVVDYKDPHGGDNSRLAMKIPNDATTEIINQIVIESTPHEMFHKRYLESILENQIGQELIDQVVGTILNYNLPVYENEVI
jgi:hypothetical protein